MLQRQPFFTDADAVIQTIRSGQVQGYITATTLTDIFYIARKPKGVQMAKQYVADLLTTMKICSVDRSILEAAISSNFNDFEDAVQLACAISENLDAIITRDVQGFAGSTVTILSAGELLNSLSQGA